MQAHAYAPRPGITFRLIMVSSQPRRSEAGHVTIRLSGLGEAAVVLFLAMVSAWFIGLQVHPVQLAGADFSPVWAAAAHSSAAYDPAALTRFQPDFAHLGPRPFAYPPTALLLFLPIGVLPFASAYAASAVVSFALFVWAARRAGSAWWIVLFSPVLLLVHIGQPSLLAGAFVLSGMTDARWRGLLFGLAFAIKPQLCLFLPLVLLLERDAKSALTAALVPAGLGLLATLAFGVSVWAEWLIAAIGSSGLCALGPQPVVATVADETAAVRHPGDPAGLGDPQY